jgi:hypothetical protein
MMEARLGEWLTYCQERWDAAVMGARRPPRRSNELGPTGERVADNIRDLRDSAKPRLSTYDLAERMAELGRPIAPTGITKIEAKGRRVDAGDLIALALALNTTPNRLLLPGSRYTDREVQLTPNESKVETEAWVWANRSLPGLEGDHLEDVNQYLPQVLQLVQHARKLADSIPDGPDSPSPGRLLLLAYLVRAGDRDHDEDR